MILFHYSLFHWKGSAVCSFDCCCFTFCSVELKPVVPLKIGDSTMREKIELFHGGNPPFGMLPIPSLTLCSNNSKSCILKPGCHLPSENFRLPGQLSFWSCPSPEGTQLIHLNEFNWSSRFWEKCLSILLQSKLNRSKILAALTQEFGVGLFLLIHDICRKGCRQFL